MIRSKISALVTAALLGLAAAPAAQAQLAQPPAAQSADAYSDTQLQSFATALLQVSRLHDMFLPRLELARTPAEQHLVVMAATDAMVEAVEKTGLTVDEYDSMLAHAQEDPALADRVRTHIQNMR
jgi:glucose/arabinose dehydrogenase